jgi:hypothetical protein
VWESTALSAVGGAAYVCSESLCLSAPLQWCLLAMTVRITHSRVRLWIHTYLPHA